MRLARPLAVSAGLALAMLAACTEAPGPERVDAVGSPLAHPRRFVAPPGAAASADTPRITDGPHVSYNGGYVLANVKVYAVLWGPNVDADTAQHIGDFYRAVLGSEMFTWLSEYDTTGFPNGTNQHLGAGTFGGAYTIVPSIPSGIVSDAQLDAELVRQIEAGNLPAPEHDDAGRPTTLYMLDFPSTVEVHSTDGPQCVKWCGYHSLTRALGTDVPYGVVPSFTAPGCDHCMLGGLSIFQNQTIVHTHELYEAVTDPQAEQSGVGWGGTGEIGDICSWDYGTFAGYTVQKLWSNASNACIVTRPACAYNDSPCQPCTVANDNGGGCISPTRYCATDASDFNVGRCVECRDSSQCGGATPICDASATGARDTCRACAANAECPTATPVCETTGPKKGSCQQCDAANHAACTGATPLCDVANGVCVGCLGAADCGGTRPVCDPLYHACGPCLDDADCDGHGRCVLDAADAQHGACVQCAKDDQCASPAVCDRASHTCVGCESDAQCSGDEPVCGQDHVCRACAADGECANQPRAHVCATSGACVACTAANASACNGATPVCDDARGACVACNADADCGGAGKACSAHACVACGGPSSPCPAAPAPSASSGGGCSASGARASGGVSAALVAFAAAAFARRRRHASRARGDAATGRP